MDTLLGIVLSFLVVISIVITVHELGHYWVGRLFNAAAESFSVGFGRPIFEVKDRRGTRWRINWLPIGGFVKFVGEIQAPTDTHAAKTGLVGKSFMELGPLKRLAISLGGPLANFVFAILVFAVWSLAVGVERSDRVVVASVSADTPAAAAGFQPGDQFIQAGGRNVVTSADVRRATSLSAGESVRFRILRDGAEMDLVAVPAEKTISNEQFKITEKVGQIGVIPKDINLRTERLGIVDAVGYGFYQTGDNLSATLTVLRRLVTGQEGLDKLSGPLGIAKIAGSGTNIQMQQEGISLDKRLMGVALWLIQLAAILSIGVGFFNLLPIPILDGGAAVMCIAEAVTGREVPEKVQKVGLTIGLACLVSFALVITWQDLTKWF
jgi:regulator of sigma E protease